MQSEYNTKPRWDAEYDFQEEMTQILSSTILLGRPYNKSYLIRFLKGDSQYKLRQEKHLSLNSYGVLGSMNYDTLQNLITYLIQQGHLFVTDNRNGELWITRKGRGFIESPKPTSLKLEHLRTPWYDYYLTSLLKELRLDEAQKQQKRIYEVFNNFGLEQIVKGKPQSLEEVKEIASMNMLEDTLLEKILERVWLTIEKKERLDLQWLFSKVYVPSCNRVRKLYLEGYTIEEIAEKRQIRPSTVIQYLSLLHMAGEIELSSWIEQQVDETILERGSLYFRQHTQGVRLKKANQELQLDYDTLWLCRAYVTRFEEEPEQRYYSKGA